MLGRLCIRGWVLVVALNVALVLAIGFSFVRPMGVRYTRNYTDGTFHDLCNEGIAFHQGAVVFFRQWIYRASEEDSGLHFMRSDAEGMRSTIYSAMHPHPYGGYSTATLGVQFGVHYPTWGSLKIIVVPFWMVLLVIGMPLGRRVYGVIVKFRRKREGCCATCGYDMRASGNRCPECGAVSISGG
jgi:hypothetical protein